MNAGCEQWSPSEEVAQSSADCPEVCARRQLMQ